MTVSPTARVGAPSSEHGVWVDDLSVEVGKNGLGVVARGYEDIEADGGGGGAGHDHCRRVDGQCLRARGVKREKRRVL